MTLTQKPLISAGMSHGTEIMNAARSSQRLRSMEVIDISAPAP